MHRCTYPKTPTYFQVFAVHIWIVRRGGISQFPDGIVKRVSLLIGEIDPPKVVVAQGCDVGGCQPVDSPIARGGWRSAEAPAS